MDGITGDEDQKRDEDVELFSVVTKLLGQQRTMAKAMAEMADSLYGIAKAYEATELDVKKLREIERRAGREDAARDIEATDAVGSDVFCVNGCYDHDTHQEGWARIARGADQPGVQPTEEQPDE